MSIKKNNAFFSKTGLALILGLAAANPNQAEAQVLYLQGCPDPVELFNELMEVERNGWEEDKQEAGLEALEIYQRCRGNEDRDLGRKLALSIWANNLESFQEALEQGAGDDIKQEALSYAVENNKSRMLSLLLDNGVENKTYAIIDAHRISERRSNTEMLDMLLADGLSDDEIFDLLKEAYRYENQAIFDLVKGIGISPDMTRKFLEEVVVYKPQYSNSLDITDERLRMLENIGIEGIEELDFVEILKKAIDNEDADIFIQLHNIAIPSLLAREELMFYAFDRDYGLALGLFQDKMSEETKVEALYLAMTSTKARDFPRNFVTRVLEGGLSQNSRHALICDLQDYNDNVRANLTEDEIKDAMRFNNRTEEETIERIVERRISNSSFMLLIMNQNLDASQSLACDMP